MGACCTCQRVQRFDGFFIEDEEGKEAEEGDFVGNGDFGARVRLQGSSRFASMFTQQGKKGTNQDAMTVWQNFAGEKDMVFCGVFDGHGPSGHKVARYVRDLLPSKLSSLLKHTQIGGSNGSTDVDDKNKENTDSKDGDNDDNDCQNPFFSSWKDTVIKSFKETDEELEGNTTVESYCSGTTAVTILKKGHHLIIANLGDSRAVLCTRGNQDQLVSIQLTVDLKPNLTNEAERIKKCGGRVLALEQEPNVFRIWMPDEDCPGLAMARAFGDFCLKDFGLVSIPEVSYRKLTDRDEFVVLATDGVWDVLTNDEVIRIVASARKRSMAARLLVDYAVQAWRYKYPGARVDDCAAICLFLKRPRPSLTKSMSETTHLSLDYSVGARHQNTTTDDGLDTVLNCDVKADTKNGDDAPDEGVEDQEDSSVYIPPRSRTQIRLRPAKGL
ncbi:unnamed protein product [Ilex paraguariensis]|uniref:PPM-type phosphatase domain-containing protein n=1 Tax=Ilex paraguariensis TaxID=185542 RepID=A0ABC8S602_9AQUA